MIPLDQQHRPTAWCELHRGAVAEALVSVPLVLKVALERCAPALIVAHNHPSGDPTPSREDDLLTRRIASACHLVGLRLLDHVVVGELDADPLRIGWWSYNARRAAALEPINFSFEVAP